MASMYGRIEKRFEDDELGWAARHGFMNQSLLAQVEVPVPLLPTSLSLS